MQRPNSYSTVSGTVVSGTGGSVWLEHMGKNSVMMDEGEVNGI